MTTTIPRRLGAAALAAATIATGLGFATPATASPTPTGTAPVTQTDDEVTRLVGPLALLNDADTAYGLSLDDSALRTKSALPLSEAEAAGEWLSVPAVGQTGPIRGLGDKADRCVTRTYSSFVTVYSCSGASSQDWTWTTVPTVQGFELGLSPASETTRAISPRGAGTYVSAEGGSQRRPMNVTSLLDSRALTADATVDRLSKTATVTGVATSGATVSAEGATPVTADATTGEYTLTVPGLAWGENPITVTQTLPNGTPYGTVDVTATMDGATRLVGPLALVKDATTSYGASFDADTLRTKSSRTSIEEALADSEFVEVPAVGAVGPVTGVGAEADKCLTRAGQTLVTPCTGASNQQFTWTTVPTLQGATTSLSPANETDKALTRRGAGTFVHFLTGDSRRPIVVSSLADSRTLTADATVDRSSKTATVTGVATSGATVSAEGATPVTADEATGAYTLTVPGLEFGDNEITLTQALPDGTPYGTVDVTATMVSPVEGVAVDPVTLDRDTATPVEVQVTHTENYNRQTGTVTMTAPEGTRFADGQTKINGQLKHAGGTWNTDTQAHALHDGVLSEDGRTMTWDYRGTVNGYGMYVGSAMRWQPTLVVDKGAPATNGEVTFTFEGTGTPGGDFRATGTSPVVVEEAPLPDDLVVTNPDAEQLAAGYTPNLSYTFEGTGNPSSEIVVRNSKGLELGPAATVTDTGDWTWTRTNMGTYNWTIDFIQDEGTPTEQRQRIANFKPAEITPGDPGTPVQVTNPTPAQIAAGYTPNAAYTFEGTGTTGSTITVQNSKGLELGPATTVTNGTWSWTRTNMGTYNWTIDFVQDKGLPTEQKARVSNFAPGQPEVPVPGVLAVTNPTPAQIAAGYTPNTSYTFEGTGTTGSTITVQNAKGLELGPAVTVTDGTWSWTRTNMGTYDWTIDFVQDKGTDNATTVRVAKFAPTPN